jgi:hypothetical protein
VRDPAADFLFRPDHPLAPGEDRRLGPVGEMQLSEKIGQIMNPAVYAEERSSREEILETFKKLD